MFSASMPLPKSCTEIRTDGRPSSPSRWPPIVRRRRSSGHAAHRLDAVHHQIQQHLLELDAVAEYARQVFGEFGADFNTALSQFATCEREHVANHIPELQRSLSGSVRWVMARIEQ